jgi:hypothetical protein
MTSILPKATSGFHGLWGQWVRTCSAQQTFGHFNSITPTVEWRLDNGKPYAAIQRWHVSDLEDATNHFLAVTKSRKPIPAAWPSSGTLPGQ